MPQRFLLALLLVGLSGLPTNAWAADPPCTGWIAVEASVEGAAILVDGKDTGTKAPATLKDIPCGARSVEASMPFYLPAKLPANVSATDVAKVKLVLKPNFGSVEILSTPQGAEVLIDGRPVGKTPVALERFDAGAHDVVIRYPDYREVTQKLNVKLGAKASLKLTLKPAFGNIKVVVRPEPDAAVALDGDTLGTAPITLQRILSGPHSIVVSKENYKPFESKLVVKDGETVQVTAILQPNFGTLSAAASLPGCEVRVDGKAVGKAPLKVKLPPGEHLVAVVPPVGPYSTVEQKVTIRLQSESKVMAKFPIKTGSLMVDTVPYAARIEMDGKSVGKAPLSLKGVAVGAHTLVAKLDNHPPLKGAIEVAEAQTAVAEMNILEPGRSSYKSGAGAKAVPSSGGRSEPPPPLTETERADRPVPPPTKPEPTPRAATPVKPVAAKPEPGPEPRPKVEPKSEPVKTVSTAPAAKPEPKPEAKPVSGAATTTTAAATSGSTPPPAPTPVTQVQERRGTSTQRTWAWITAGTATGLAVTSVVLFAVGASTQNEADTAYQNHEPIDRVTELDKRAALERNWGWVCAASTAAAAGAALYLFLSDDSGSTAVGVMPIEGGGMLGISGRF